MTAVQEKNQNTDVAEDVNEAEERVSISLNDLIIGRTLNSPLYDTHGVLLLAADSEITPEVKDALKNRGDNSVMVSQEDLSRVTLSQIDPGNIKSIVQFDSELTKKIDAIVESGLLTVKNDGPSVKDKITFLGRKGYDQKQREHLVRQHERNGQALDTMMSEALHGETMDGEIVSAMAAQYLQEMTTDTDNVLTSAMDQFQGDSIATRSLEVSLLAMAIGIEMDLDADNARNLAVAGLVHDWGMMRVPEEIRNATERLNQVQMLEIKKHPIYSLEMLQNVSSLPRVISVIAYQVHERFNGTGYPRGRKGNSIHLFARILQIADAFIGMTSPRPYRPPMMRYAAMECLIRQAKERYVDPDVVRALLKIQSLFPIGSFVTLTDGSVAQVVRRNKDYYTEPIVVRVQDAQGNSLDREDDSNLIDLREAEGLNVRQALPTPGSNEIAFSEDLYNTSLAKIQQNGE